MLIVYARGIITSGLRHVVENLANQIRADGLNIRMAVIASPETPAIDVFGVSFFHDGNNAFSEAYGPNPDSCFLIRPDGYVGYHATRLIEAGVIVYLRTADLAI